MPLTTEEVSSDRQIYINLMANPDPPSIPTTSISFLSLPLLKKAPSESALKATPLMLGLPWLLPLL